jgi:pSer/pThr/pTyr-binding forkhead associated (FHA) protein/uncharacterized protein involved in exopolysaccharide biosynthesis
MSPSGREPQGGSDAGSGLDARLDKAVPTEAAIGFLLAGDGTQPGRVFPLTRNTNIVGRSEKADVRIAQPAVSSEHASIINGSLGFEVEDLNSVNGTFVNGVRITRAKLQRGDRLTLGNVEFTFLVEKNAEATMALLPPRARRTTTLTGLRPVNAIARDNHDDEGGMSFADVVRQAVGVWRTMRPHLPLAAKFVSVGVVVGLASAVALPPPNMAVSETKLHPVKKANPVDGAARSSSEEDSVQFFIDPERSFVSMGLVKSTLQKLDGKMPDDARVASFQSRLTFTSLGERLYRAAYIEPKYAKMQPTALVFLAAHVDNYLKTDVEKGLSALDNEAQFLAEKLAKTSADLTAINNQLAAFKKAHADDLPETADQAHSSRYYLESRKSELTAQIARLAGELAVDEAQLKEGNPLQQAKFQASQVYRSSQQAIRQKLSEAYSKGYADGHPEIQQMKNELERLDKVIEQEMKSESSEADRTAEPVSSGLKAKVGVERAQLRAAHIELEDAERQLEKVKRAVTVMPALAAQLDDLQRKYDSTKRLHDQLSDQSQKASLQLEVERLGAKSRSEVVTPAFLVTPDKVKTFATRAGMGFGAALALAVLVAAFIEARKLVRRFMASGGARA